MSAMTAWAAWAVGAWAIGVGVGHLGLLISFDEPGRTPAMVRKRIALILIWPVVVVGGIAWAWFAAVRWLTSDLRAPRPEAQARGYRDSAREDAP